MLIAERQKEIVEEFRGLEDWEARYKKIIDLGKALPDLPEEKKLEDFKVRGCQSQVWMHARKEGENIVYEADSDALIVRGLVALLLRVFSEAPAQEILTATPDFVGELGLQNHLSPSRANGLFAMIKQIKFYALALEAKA